jgi:hypothetical protein
MDTLKESERLRRDSLPHLGWGDIADVMICRLIREGDDVQTAKAKVARALRALGFNATNAYGFADDALFVRDLA